jgi:DNA replication protein DnaC
LYSANGVEWEAPMRVLPCLAPSSYTVQPLANKLKENQSSQKPYLNAGLVIVDEAGYLPVTTQEAHLFFQFVSYRYEKSSTIILRPTKQLFLR